MKNRKMFAIFCILLLALSVNLMAEPVKVIAVHFGNPEYESSLTKENYPGFMFYHTDGTEWKYVIENALYIGGLPSHLEGFYGEIPEKMGFSASFATEKGGAIPYNYGVAYLIGTNGVVAAQTGPYSEFLDGGEVYYADFNNLKKNLKKIKKNTLPKALPATKQVYFKTAPVGEREAYKKSVIDKKAAGLVGWNLPDVGIYDETGEKHMLSELVKDQNCFVVFYTMKAALIKEGNRKTGDIGKEFYAEMPVDPAKEMTEAAQNAENAQTKEDVQNMFKSMLKAVADDMNSFYDESVGVLEMVKDVNESVK
jgi:hypothetical protein